VWVEAQVGVAAAEAGAAAEEEERSSAAWLGFVLWVVGSLVLVLFGFVGRCRRLGGSW
jgi:hypothetical protein